MAGSGKHSKGKKKGKKIGRNRDRAKSYEAKGKRERNKKHRMDKDSQRTKIASCGHASRYIKRSFSAPGSWFCTKCKKNVKA